MFKLQSAFKASTSKSSTLKPLAFATLALVFAAPVSSAFAADQKPMSPQQKKMSSCSKDAKGKSGDERRAFMKKCLSAKAASSTPTDATNLSPKFKG
jgi:hypothetical protein